MKLQEAIKTRDMLRVLGYGIENNVVESIDLNTIAHFGNVVCLEISCSNVVPYSAYNNTKNVGYLVRAIIDLLGLEQEDGVRLSNIKKIPCRLVFENDSEGHWGEKAIGIGNFMHDKFVLFTEFTAIDQ